MKYKYTGDDERVFPDVSLIVNPGDTIDVEINPDEKFFQAVTDTKSATPIPTPTPTPPVSTPPVASAPAVVDGEPTTKEQ